MRYLFNYKISFFLFSFLLLVLVVSYSEQEAKDFSKELSIGYEYYKSGQYQSSCETFSSLLKRREFSLHPDYPKVVCLYCFMLDSTRDAILFLEKHIGSIKDSTFLCYAYYLLGLQKDLIGDFDGAIKAYENALFVLHTKPTNQKSLETFSPHFKLPDYGALNYRAGLLATFLGDDDLAKKYIANIKSKEETFPFYSLCAVVLESRLFLKNDGIAKGILPIKYQLENLLKTKNKDIPILFFYWGNYLLENYPSETVTIKDDFNKLLESLSNKSNFLSMKAVLDPALQLATLTPVLSNDTESKKEELPKDENRNYKERIQIASFSDKENALYYAKDVKAHGFECQITKTTKGVFRVYVLVKDGEVASTTLLKLKDLGYEGILH